MKDKIIQEILKIKYNAIRSQSFAFAAFNRDLEKKILDSKTFQEIKNNLILRIKENIIIPDSRLNNEQFQELYSNIFSILNRYDRRKKLKRIFGE
jgi:hypothetical protein